MLYTTIMLELLQASPALYRELRVARRLLSTVERTATDLKNRHPDGSGVLTQQRPGSAPEQITSEALEIAVREIRDAMPFL